MRLINFFHISVLTGSNLSVCVNNIQEGLAMKQKKLLKKLYQACLSHDVKAISELRKTEFAKILKHRAEGKPFTGKWSVVRI